MEITILGSGTGTPSLTRNATGLLITIGKKKLIFDIGPGIVKKLLEIGITYHDIDYIFFSHFHTDHTLDFAAFLFAAKYALSLRTKKLTIIGPKGLERFYNALSNLYGDVIKPEAYEIELKEIQEQSLEFDTFKINTLPMQHTPESTGYRIEADAKTIAYSGDTDVCENVIKLGQGADVLILDCSFPDEMKVKGHLTAQEAGRIAEMCGCKRLVLSHLYPVCSKDEITKQAKKEFKGKTTVAYDLMKLLI